MGFLGAPWLLYPASVKLLGDGTNDGDVIGDPVAQSEIAVGVNGGLLIAWSSPWQSDVTVPALSGLEWNQAVTNLSLPASVIKAVATYWTNTLLANVNFINAITGQNRVAPSPTAIINAIVGTYPLGGTTKTFVMPYLAFPAGGTALTFPEPTLTYPKGGVYVPWSAEQNLGLAWETDQNLV